jgi:hypothetical protein
MSMNLANLQGLRMGDELTLRFGPLAGSDVFAYVVSLHVAGGIMLDEQDLQALDMAAIGGQLDGEHRLSLRIGPNWSKLHLKFFQERIVPALASLET